MGKDLPYSKFMDQFCVLFLPHHALPAILDHRLGSGQYAAIPASRKAFENALRHLIEITT
jgi:hypothetical protein